jgi:hypothetical protein
MSYTESEMKEICAAMLEDLKVFEGDAILSDDGLGAIIPYYSHGRTNHHTIDLEAMARTALVFSKATPS